MAEFEELRLTIVLVDNATAGIKAMRVELRAVEADAYRFRQKMQELTRDNKDFSTSLNRVNTQTALLAAAAGYAGSKINELQDKVYEQLTVLSRFSREMQQISNAAKLLGISFGQLNSIIDQGRQFGLDEATIKNITAAMLTLQAQLKTRAGIDKFRADMMGKYKLDPRDLEAYIDRLRGATTVVEFHKALQETGNIVEEKEFQRTKDRELARQLRQEWITSQGLPAHLSLLKKLDEATVEYLHQQEAVLQAVTRWNDSLNTIQRNLESIRDTFYEKAMSKDGEFYRGLKTAELLTKKVTENLGSWLAKLKKFANAFMSGVKGLLQNPGAGQAPPELFRPKKQSFQSEQIEELADLIHNINEIMRPTGPRIVPAALTPGGGVTGGGAPTGGGTAGGGGLFGGAGAFRGLLGGGGGPQAAPGGRTAALPPSGGPGGAPPGGGGGGGGGGPAAAPPAPPPGVPAPGVPSAPAPVVPGGGTGGAPYSPRVSPAPGGGPAGAPPGGGTPGGTPSSRDIPFPRSGSETERGGALYDKLLAEFRANPPQGIPPDGARFGITKGTPEEWARFGVAVAKRESSFDPRVENLSDPGGSHGVFQYAHGQAYGNAFDVDNSVRAFVRDARSSSVDKAGLGGGILGRRFSTIGRHPERAIQALPAAERIAQGRERQPPTQDLPQGGFTPIPKAGGYNRADISMLRTQLDRGLMPGTPPAVAQPTVPGTLRPGTRVEEAQGGATYRVQPIDPRLKATLDYAAEQSGLKVRVTSGGQPPVGRRTGSLRHNYGLAADFDLLDENGKEVPRDDPRRVQFLEEMAAAGGGGVGTGYMNPPTRIHGGLTGATGEIGKGLGQYNKYAATKAEIAAIERGLARSRTFDRTQLERRGETQRVDVTDEDKQKAYSRLLGGQEFKEGGATPVPQRGGFTPVDRSFLDRQMGNKIQLPKVEGEGKVSIKVTEPKDVGGTPKGLFKEEKIERQDTMGDSKKGPEVVVTGDNKDTGAGGELEAD